MLPRLLFPAYIADSLTYIRAWNQGIEMIWAPSQLAPAPINIMEDIFSERVRERMGDRWNLYVLRALRIFRQRTVRRYGDPHYRHLVTSLHERYGDLFVERWNAAELESTDPETIVDGGLSTVRHESPAGPIEFVVTNMIGQVPLDFDLTVYVPIGRENLDLYSRATTGLNLSQLYFADE